MAHKVTLTWNPPVTGDPAQSFNIKRSTVQTGPFISIEYISLNDEPLLNDPDEMVGFPSVQVCAIAFGKTYEQVATAVVQYRRKYREGDK